MRHNNLLVALVASAFTPIRLYADAPAKEPTLVEKLNAWLKDKEQLTTDLSAATQRASTAEAALATARTEAQTAATAAATALTEATGKLATAQNEADEAKRSLAEATTQLGTFTAAFASVGFKPTTETLAKAEAFQTAWNTHIANGVTAKLAELGVSASKLPSAASEDDANTEAELVAALATTKDPEARGKIGAKLNALRDVAWGKSTGKN